MGILSFLVFLAAQPIVHSYPPPFQCCERKVFGDDAYTLSGVNYYDAKLYGCNSEGGCIYFKEGTIARFCFRHQKNCCESPTTTPKPSCYGKDEISKVANIVQKDCESDPCLYKGINFPGADINNGDIKTDTAEECSCLCKQVCDCKVFSWTVSSKQCWLKTVEAKNNRKDSDEEVSGVMGECDSTVTNKPPTTPSCYGKDEISKVANIVQKDCEADPCLYKGINFPGADINNG